jgi:hypothetical protein
MKWTDYVLRRKINADVWIRNRSIDSKQMFCGWLARLDIELPSDDELNLMFPEKKEIVENEPESITTERIDPPAAWSLAGAGDDADLYPSGKSSPKFRGKRT